MLNNSLHCSADPGSQPFFLFSLLRWTGPQSSFFLVFLIDSKSVDLLKTQFPALEESIKGVLIYQMNRQADDTRWVESFDFVVLTGQLELPAAD